MNNKMSDYENKVKMVSEETKVLLEDFYNSLNCRIDTKRNMRDIALDFCVEFKNKEMTYLNLVDYFNRTKKWKTSYLNKFLRFYSLKRNDDLALNVAQNKIKIGGKKYSFVYLKDLSLFPFYYDFINKCFEASYSHLKIYNCSRIFINYLNVLGKNEDHLDVKKVWYSFKYDFEIESIQNYYKEGKVLPFVDFRACSRSKYQNEYKELVFKKYLKERIEGTYQDNQDITYDFFVMLLDTRDYEPSTIVNKINHLQKFNEFLGCDYSLITQKRVDEFTALYRAKKKSQRDGFIYTIGELTNYLYDKGILENKIVVMTKKCKYPPVYIHEYADENDEIRANKDRRMKCIRFEQLNNFDCLDKLTEYAIYLLKESRKPYASIQQAINILSDLANCVGKQFETVLSEEFVDYFDKYYRCVKSTRNSYKLYFSDFYEWLCRKKYIENNIVNIEFEPIEYIDKNVSYSAYELQVLFTNMYKLPDDMYRLALVLLAATGMRISEIVNIRRSMIKKVEEFYFIMVNSDKAEKYQKSYISKSIYEYVMNYIKKYPSKTDYLFVNRFGKKTRVNTISRGLRKFTIDNDLRNESGEIIDVYTHKFRHNIAVSLQNSGAPITIIQCVLNHNSLETTKHYTDNAKELVEKRRMKALGISDIAKENIPKIRASYDEIINSEVVTQVLISGACKKKAYTDEGKKCSNNPNDCYKCKFFLPDESKLEDYKTQLKELIFVKDRYGDRKDPKVAEINKIISELAEVIDKMERIYVYEKSDNIRQLSI